MPQILRIIGQRSAASLKYIANTLVYPVLNHPLLSGLSALAGVAGFAISFFNPLQVDDPFKSHILEGVTQLMAEADVGFDKVKSGEPKINPNYLAYKATNTMGGECSYPEIWEYPEPLRRKFTCTFASSVPTAVAREKYKSVISALRKAIDDDWTITEDNSKSNELIWEAEGQTERWLIQVWFSENSQKMADVDFYFETEASLSDQSIEAIFKELKHMMDDKRVELFVKFEPFVLIMFTDPVGIRRIGLDEAKSYYFADSIKSPDQSNQPVALFKAYMNSFKQHANYNTTGMNVADSVEFLKTFSHDIASFGELRLPSKTDIKVNAAMVVFPNTVASEHAVGILVDTRSGNEQSAFLIVYPIAEKEGGPQLGDPLTKNVKSFAFNLQDSLDSR